MRTSFFINIAILFASVQLLVQFAFLHKTQADICTKPAKPIKYSIRSGEDFYSILKNFGLDPVIGAGGSLDRLQTMNKLVDQTSVEAGTEIFIPFSCEEQLLGWRLIDKGQYRLITSEKIDKLAIPTEKIKSENIGPDNTTADILNKAMPGDDVDLDTVGDNTADVSEALRYRMICDGEWTGAECITRYSALFTTGGAWYNRYDGVDRTTAGSGTLLSKLNPEVGFGWSNYWSGNFRTDFSFSVINNQIYPDVRERPIEQAKKTLNTLNADARYELGRWGVKAGITQRERLFYRFADINFVVLNDGGVIVNAIPVLDLHAGLSYMAHQKGKFRVDTELTFVSMQATNTSGYKVTPGTALEFGMTVTHDRVKEYIFGTMKYELSQQDTDILSQKAAELGFKFGYAWKLKDW
jgi:hypothetical protein